MTELYKLILENKILGQPYIYTLTGILLLIYLINYIKKNEFFEGGYRLYSTIKNRDLKRIDKRIDSPQYSNEEKEYFSYKKKVLEYKSFYKISENNLAFFNYVNGFEDQNSFRRMYKNSSKFLKFNREKKELELAEPIDHEKAQRNYTIGEIIFVLNGMLSYLLFTLPFLTKPEKVSWENALLIVFVIIPFVFIQIYLGWLFMRYMQRKKHALMILEMKRINLDELKDV
ncbi:hypothetical protein [Acinetobacter baumannii]|uniref:hypothetical protein n=1 Tax=Acinetobacter baumannii TaxID=470 RepID=UPI0022B40FD2|nr:hypothetical protein [Acinetobacter baumannii]MDC5105283.1 hypothetical protein [Acinetobacter baumannii]MDC5177230.1 hypothetical protein [Acinetobacter baumannii]